MKKLYILAVAVFMAGLLAQAEVVGYYPFNGKSKASADSETNSVAGELVVGAGVTTFKWETRGFWSPTQPSAAFNAGTDFADTNILDDDYFSFTITPEPGKTLDFTSLSFIDRSGGFSVSIASDQDSFATVVSSTAAAGSWATNTLDLSGLADTTGAIELRLYFHNGSGDPRMIDNVTISADISSGGSLPPATPTGLTAVPGNGLISLDWDDNSESGVTYSVYRSTTSGSYVDVLTSGLTTSDYVDNTASNYTTYYYVVNATDTSNNKSPKSDEVSATPSDPDDTTPPAAPTGLVAVGGAGSVSLNWDDNSEVDLASYSVYRSTNSGSYGSALTNGLSASAYVDSTAAIGTIYYYVVTAVDFNSNESADSNEDSATPDITPPAAPTGLAATADDSAVFLDWADNPEADLGTYSVYRSTTSGSYSNALATGVSSSDYVDSSAVNDTTYYYVVAAVDINGNESAQSSQASTTPAFKYFAKYTITGSSYASSDVSTNSTASDLVPGGGLGVSFETRQFGVRGNPVPSLKWNKANMNDETLLDNDYLAFSITNNSSGSLTFGSLSFDYSGNGSDDIYLFSSQNGFSSLGDAIGGVNVGWPTDFDNYTISLSGMTNAAASSVTEFRLYFYSSASSGEVWMDNIKLDITPAAPGPDNIPPEAPAGLNATAGNNSVSLNWGDNTEDDFDSYSVYRSETSGDYGSALASNLTSSSYVDNTAMNSNTYYYVVTATDTSGNESLRSGEDFATPNNSGLAGYSLWLFENGVADTDANFYEYAMGSDPTDGLASTNNPVLVGAGGSLYYVYPKRSDDETLTYTVETTTNIVDSGSWGTGGTTAAGTYETGGTLNYVSNAVDTAESERFIRLKIEQ